MPLTKRHLRRFLQIFLIVILGGSLLLGGAFLWLRQNADSLLRGWLDGLSAETGLSFSVGYIEVGMQPMPVLAADYLTVSGRNVHFAVTKAVLSPDYAALLKGSFKVSTLFLHRPELVLELEGAIAGDGATAMQPIAIPPELTDASLAVTDGHAVLSAPDASLYLKGLSCRIGALDGNSLRGRVQLDYGRATLKNWPVLEAEALKVEGTSSLLSFFKADGPRLSLSAVVRCRPWLEMVGVEAELKGTSSGWNALADLSGKFSEKGVMIPFSVKGIVSGSDPASPLALSGVSLRLGRDSGVLNGKLSLSEGSLEGRLDVRRVSLTEWFGFARGLPPGLQKSLDSVTDGHIAFRLDGKGLSANHVEARCAGAFFSGTGGVADWKNPVIALDMKSPHVVLDDAIPEAVGVLPAEPVYLHSPLTPQESSPYVQGETYLGYDIRLRADAVDYGPLLVEDARVAITPGKMDEKGMEDVLLKGEARFYGGSFKGNLILGSAPELPYAISAEFKNVDGKGVGNALTVLPLRSGRWAAQASVMSVGRELKPFLDNLRGTAWVQGSGGAIVFPGNSFSLPFTSLRADLGLRSGAWKKACLGLDGQWKAKLEDKDVSLKAGLSGMLWFGDGGTGAGGLDFSNAPGTFAAMLGAKLCGLSTPLQAEGKGRFSCNGRNRTVSFTQSDIRVLGGAFSGQGSVRFAKGGPSFQGEGDFAFGDVKKTAQLITGRKAELPSWLSKLALHARFKGSKDSVTLSGIRMMIDKSTVTGSLSVVIRKAPRLEADLAVDSCNLDRWLGDAGREGKKHDSGRRLDFSALKGVTAGGALSLANVVFKRLRFTNVKIPFSLRGETLECRHVTGQFYGGPLQAKAVVGLSSGVDLKAEFSAGNVSLAGLSRDRMRTTHLEGTADASGRISAVMSTTSQWPHALNGSWKCRLRAGSFQRMKENGEKKGKPTEISRLEASGVFEKGVMRSRNILMTGKGLQVDGGGWLDMDKETLDCNFNVNLKGLPNFPLRIYGSLDKPKTSIGAGTLILNAIGSLGQGIIDLFGGILSLFIP
ncbi:MAG: hypothetical protein K6F46_01440 [Desulfovibrio sp.]|nr:hypothetical protein [Desulfovibrio sp.]